MISAEDFVGKFVEVKFPSHLLITRISGQGRAKRAG